MGAVCVCLHNLYVCVWAVCMCVCMYVCVLYVCGYVKAILMRRHSNTVVQLSEQYFGLVMGHCFSSSSLPNPQALSSCGAIRVYLGTVITSTATRLLLVYISQIFCMESRSNAVNLLPRKCIGIIQVFRCFVLLLVGDVHAFDHFGLFIQALTATFVYVSTGMCKDFFLCTWCSFS